LGKSKVRPLGARMVRLAPGVALPWYMYRLLEGCRPAGYTRRAVEAGGLLAAEYMPGYLEFECSDPESVAREARRLGLRVYRGRRHLTISDGVYSVRVYKA